MEISLRVILLIPMVGFLNGCAHTSQPLATTDIDGRIAACAATKSLDPAIQARLLETCSETIAHRSGLAPMPAVAVDQERIIFALARTADERAELRGFIAGFSRHTKMSERLIGLALEVMRAQKRQWWVRANRLHHTYPDMESDELLARLLENFAKDVRNAIAADEAADQAFMAQRSTQLRVPTNRRLLCGNPWRNQLTGIDCLLKESGTDTTLRREEKALPADGAADQLTPESSTAHSPPLDY